MIRSALLLLLALPALAAKPVARPVRGNLDERVVTQDAAGVVVQFDGLSRADAQKELDALAAEQKLSNGLRVGFFKTPLATLAALYVTAPGPLTVKRLLELAAAGSRRTGVKAAWAVLHPGPRNEELETEGWWRYEQGKLAEQKRLSFRDDEAYVQWVRRKLTGPQLEEKKWAGWPLSALCVTLGIPGRDFLERAMGLLDLAEWPAPADAGVNLSLLLVYLPDATALEIRQAAEKQHGSASKVVSDALHAADTAGELAVAPPKDVRAPWDEQMPQAEKTPGREVPLFLDRPLLGRLDVRADEESVSLSHLVEYAWRKAHPHAPAKSHP